MRGLLSPLRHSPFRLLIAGQALSLVGDRLSYLAVVALLSSRTHGFETTGGGALSALALALLLPFLVLSPWAAVHLDRWRRRNVMLAADAGRAAVSFAMAAAALSTPMPVLFALVAASSAFNVFFLPARVAIVPDLVGPEELDRANGLGVLASVLATLVGTLLGGPLIAAWGIRAALALDGVSYLCSAASLAAMPAAPAPSRAPRETEWTSWLPRAAAFRALLGRGQTRAAALLLGLTWILGGLFHVCGTLRLQALTPRVTDLMAPALACLGAGGVLGAALVGSRLGAHRSRIAGAGLFAAGLAVGVFAMARGLPGIAGAALAAGLATAPVYILADSEIQRALPAAARAGALAARDFVCRSAFLVTVLLCGAATPASSQAWILGGAALLGLSGIWYGWRKPLSN